MKEEVRGTNGLRDITTKSNARGLIYIIIKTMI